MNSYGVIIQSPGGEGSFFEVKLFILTLLGGALK